LSITAHPCDEVVSYYSEVHASAYLLCLRLVLVHNHKFGLRLIKWENSKSMSGKRQCSTARYGDREEAGNPDDCDSLVMITTYDSLVFSSEGPQRFIFSL